MEMEKSTKGEKSDNKNRGPLFPRLHVDDTKKVGIRAPPRNKMALYEQLSVPAERMNSRQISTIPPRVHGPMLTNMSSSTQGVRTERSMLQLYKNSPTPAYSNGKQTSRSNEILSDNASANSTKKLMIVRSENVAERPLPKFESCNLSQFKRPFQQIDEAALRVPTFTLSLDSSNNNSGLNEPIFLELQTTKSAKRVKTLMSTDVESARHVRVIEESQGNDRNSTPTSQGRDNLFRNVSLKPSTKQEHSELSDGMVNETDTIKAKGHMDMLKKVCKGDATESNESCYHESPTKDVCYRRNLIDANGNQVEENQVKSEDNNKERLHTSVKDCATHAAISPDHVGVMIGQKYFWQARKTIIHQQRVFAMQVFELHRIMKVQRMLTGTANIQKVEHFPWGNAHFEPTSMKELLSVSIPDAPSWHSKSTKEASNTKLSVLDNPFEKPALPLSSDKNTAHNFSKSTNINLPMWCLPPPGNQWLLPVISPSEGLIYKPYPHNQPPHPGFMNSSNAVHGSAQPDPTCFAPYAMPMMNQFASGSTIKQMTGLTSFNSLCAVYPASCINNGNDTNLGEAKDTEKMESIISCPKKIKASYDALPLFPTTPTTFEFAQPVQSCKNEQKTQVIKVIPRNPRFASESAARIIKLIQEERKHCCN